MPLTKEEYRTYLKKWREEHKGYFKKWYQEHKEYRKECDKKWRNNNKEYMKEYNKKWNEDHKEQRKEHHKKYRKTHKENIKEQRKKYRKTHKENIKEYSLKYKYSLTLTEYNKLLKDQNNKCLICKIDLVKPYIDHNHINGKVRGILCYTCNIGLGHFKDDRVLLLEAIAYLDKDINITLDT